MPYIKHIEIKKDKKVDAFPFNLPSLKHLDLLELHPAVTFFVGENGSGKSTLIESIAVAAGFNHEGGSRNFNFSTGENTPVLAKALRLSRSALRPKNGYFYRSESFYNVITNMNQLDEEPCLRPLIKDSYGGRDLHTRSHGESLLDLIVHRFGKNGLYIFDEPESSLSAQHQLAFLSKMAELVSLGCQFIIATHSPILITFPNAIILEFSADGINQVNYSETDNFVIMKCFINNPDRFLNTLL
ncbi:AAA family ATPase [Celerinatantimonas yamalensis]|uniref:AAA family ATPase n=1 Tax=Celerinatantimonas yamalensis TaxID=559956 RepID=A0ABW9G6T1_9GAMM